MLPRLSLLFSLALLVGCTGVIDDSMTGVGMGMAGGPGGGTGGSHAGGSAGGNGGSGVHSTGCNAISKTLSVGPAPLRRLTKAEYDNTIADLLLDTSKPSAGFPQEGKLFGFDNIAEAQVVTSELAGDYFEAGETLAGKAIAKLDTLVPCDTVTMGEDACARAFIATFGMRAFRRPLAAEDITPLVAMYAASKKTEDHKSALGLVLQRMLSAPDFLYRPEFGDPAKAPAANIRRLTSWEMASRLSYLLWNTMPDGDLFAAAGADMLRTVEQVAAQAKRLLASDRARGAVARFHEGWLRLDKLDQADKDDKAYPGFDAQRAAMREEITRFTGDVFWGGDGSIDTMFAADYTFMAKPLATFLKLPGAASATAAFQRFDLAGAGGTPATTGRLGLLTTAGLLAANSKPLATSPILRGKYVAEQMLCVEIPPPPPNVPAAPVEAKTTRERFLQHAKAACATCHKSMDPIGFAFEGFDTVGRARDSENGYPIDASGTLATGKDIDGDFVGPVEFGKRLAASADMRKCVAKQWFRYAQGREETGIDAKSLQQLSCGFDAGKHSLRDLLAGLVQTDSFMYLAVGGSP